MTARQFRNLMAKIEGNVETHEDRRKFEKNVTTAFWVIDARTNDRMWSAEMASHLKARIQVARDRNAS